MSKSFLLLWAFAGFWGCASSPPSSSDIPNADEGSSEWRVLFDHSGLTHLNPEARVIAKIRLGVREKSIIDVDVSQSRSQGGRAAEEIYRARIDCEHASYLIEEGSVIHKMSAENGATTKVPMKFTQRWVPVDARELLWKSAVGAACSKAH